MRLPEREVDGSRQPVFQASRHALVLVGKRIEYLPRSESQAPTRKTKARRGPSFVVPFLGISRAGNCTYEKAESQGKMAWSCED